MTELRWILLVAGIALLVGLYLWDTRSRRRSAAPEIERAARFEPAPASVPPPTPAPAPAENARVEPPVWLDEESPPPVVRATQRREPTLAREVAPEPPAPEEPRIEEEPEAKSQKIVAVRIMARSGERFEGAQLLDALRAEGLEFGRYDIFHRLDPAGRPVFSMASLVEPGTFDPRAMPGSAYPGIAAFAVLPGPVSAQQAFEELLATAHTLAGRLGGLLQDDRGASLSMQRITALHEELREFDRARHARPGH
ncbi:MAG: cell division protein ZipA C-terminal FtsZ-binding domain-containing protein [Steroidobacteraceae bacterium]